MLAVSVPPALASPLSPDLKVRAKWYRATHQLFVDASWASTNGEASIRASLKAGSVQTSAKGAHWVVPRKIFTFELPKRGVKRGTKATITVTLRTPAGSATKIIKLTLN